MHTYSPDGVRIAYDVKGEGEPTLVFVHGWCCDRSYWQPQVQHLSQQYRVVAIDLAGHGESGLNRAQWSMQAFAADVVAVLEQLGVATGVLIGHSMGGPIVLEAGIRAPDRVLGVIGVEAFFDDWSLIDAEPFRKNFAETTTAFVKSMFMPESDRDLIERVASDMASDSSAVGSGALEGIRKWAADDFDRAFREIKAPVRMIQRERTPDLLTQVRRHAPSLTSFDIAVMPGVSHFAMMEQPMSFNRLLQGFVDGIAAAHMRMGPAHNLAKR
jgi:pimeloyl-ACP methyl ester carboxylesterase